MFDPLDTCVHDSFELPCIPDTFQWQSEMPYLDSQLDPPGLHIEREICTNFTCCGLAIADLHELLDHFEERHVLVLPDGSAPYYPSARPLPHPQLTPLVLSFPRPLTPPTHEWTPSLVDATSDASSSASDSEACPPSPVDMPVCALSPTTTALPPASFTSPLPPHPPTPKALSTSSSTPSSSTRVPLERGPGGRFKPKSFKSKHRSRPLLSSPITSLRSSAPASPLSSGISNEAALSRRRRDREDRERERERAFRCPKPGCVKTYLNPNGLKYHLEKGTCKLADASEDDSNSPMHDA